MWLGAVLASVCVDVFGAFWCQCVLMTFGVCWCLSMWFGVCWRQCVWYVLVCSDMFCLALVRCGVIVCFGTRMF